MTGRLRVVVAPFGLESVGESEPAAALFQWGLTQDVFSLLTRADVFDVRIVRFQVEREERPHLALVRGALEARTIDEIRADMQPDFLVTGLITEARGAHFVEYHIYPREGAATGNGRVTLSETVIARFRLELVEGLLQALGQPLPPELREQCLVGPPSTVEAYRGYCRAFADLDQERQVQQLEALVAQDPDFVDAAITLAQCHVARHQPEAAIPMVEAARRRFPAHHGLLLQMAELCSLAGAVGLAEQLYQEALERGPRKGPIHYMLGVVFERQKRWTEAERSLRAALAAGFTAPACYDRLGVVMARQRRMGEAVVLWEEAVRRDPTHATAWGNLALAAQHRGDLDEAERHYRKAVELDPAQPVFFYNYGNLCVARQDFARARIQFAKAVELKEDFAVALLNLGLCHMHLGEQELARECFAKVIRLAPETEVANMAEQNLAHMDLPPLDAAQAARFEEASGLVLEGQSQRGLELLAALVEIYPDFWNAWYLIGMAQRQLEHYAAAEDAFHQVLRIRPGAADAHNELAALDLVQRRFVEGCEHAQKAYDARPDDAGFACNLAMAYIHLGKLDEGGALLDRAAELAPDDAIVGRCRVFLETCRRKASRERRWWRSWRGGGRLRRF